MNGRNPSEVSLYLGLATAIATFSAAAFALGLLQCGRGRERVISVSVLFCATVGIAAALIIVARGRTSGLGNIMIGAGIFATAAFVLTRALRTIFTSRDTSKTASGGRPAHNSSTQGLPVVWTGRWEASQGPAAAPSAQPPDAVLRRPLWAASAGFLVLFVLATAGAAPDVRDLLKDFLRSRPVGQSGADAPCPGASRVTKRETLQAASSTTLCLLNWERTRRGLKAVRLSDALSLAATRHSEDMVAQKFFSSVSPGGVTLRQRVRRVGYKRANKMAETIAWGAGTLGTPAELVASFMASSGHKQIVLDGQYDDVGIGLAPGAPAGRAGPGAATLTLDFGGR